VDQQPRVPQVTTRPAGLHRDRDAPLELRGRVLEDGGRIYSGDAARRVALERHTLSRYHDYKAEYAAMHERRLRATAIDGL